MSEAISGKALIIDNALSFMSNPSNLLLLIPFVGAAIIAHKLGKRWLQKLILRRMFAE